MYRATIDPTAAVSDPALAPYFTGPALQQIVFVLSGVGLLGIDDAEQELRPGEVITLPAQIWHGASVRTEVQMLSITHPGPIQWRESLGDITSG
jgi:cupin domain